MPLNKDLQEQNIVVLAQGFKPSTFNQHWFIKNAIIDNESEFSPDSIISPDIAKIMTKEFLLIVTTEYMQFTVKKGIEFEHHIEKNLNSIISKTDVLYSAIGFNSGWFIYDSGVSFSEFNRNFFNNKDSKIPLHNFFNEPNAKFGTYMSKDFLGSRLKLDVKPIQVVDERSHLYGSEFLFFKFNYHKELDSEDKHKQLLEILLQWKNYSEETHKIISSI